jgi:hypothetical protein
MKYRITQRLTLMALALVALSPLGRAQAQIAGDWQGTLDAGGTQLRLALHIIAAPDGSLKATWDSIDQGANGLPINAISLKDSKLAFSVDAAHITYEGTLNKDATQINGTWTQGQPLKLDFKRTAAQVTAAPKPAPPSEIDGTWLGTLDVGPTKLRVVFKIINTPDGLTAHAESPDQGPGSIPATSVKRDGNSLTIIINALQATFEGKIAADLNSIDGTFTQRNQPLPLTLKRVKDQSAVEPLRRPQNPVKPYPYREEEVTYANKAAGTTLAATLAVPSGQGPFPAVLLISGSGPNDRDESMLGHKPFLVLSDYLTRRGIAVLRADKRGIGKSTGNLAVATTADFATDAEAGVAYLKTRSEVDPHKIGLVGHSEGGVIAPMVAARNSDVAFIVMMAGDGVPGDQIIVEQVRLLDEVAGASKEKAAEAAVQERELLTLVEAEKNEAALDKKLREQLAADGVPEAQIGVSIQSLTSPWYRYFLTYDPATALRKVACPVLVLNGSKDLQVPPAQNLPAIRKALEDGGNKHFEIDEMPGLNHLFQTAKTGSPTEYAQIEETISPAVLDKIAGWILKQKKTLFPPQ